MKTLEWTFKDWLMRFRNVDLPIGDLAHDVASDPEFPDSQDYDRLRNYFSSKGKHVIDTFIPVWEFYRSSTRSE